MTKSRGFAWECRGCGARTEPWEPYPFRCPRADAGDDIDHLLHFSPLATGFCEREEMVTAFGNDEPNPFVRFRALSAPFQLAHAAGMSQAAFTRIVGRLNAAVARIDGNGFHTTPNERSEALTDVFSVGSLWIKDETGNVAGSHKARHLMGVMLWLEVVNSIDDAAAYFSAEAAGLRPGRVPETTLPLAIASCGNAALAAAVMAKAAGRPLEVFVPPHADPVVADRLEQLGARIAVCPRDPDTPGDPCLHQFHQAVAGGALPFTCQGPENGLVIDGGRTLAYEMIAEFIPFGGRIDRLFIQVGGGALATSVAQGFEIGCELGLIEAVPKLHTVQTQGGWPLARAYDRLAERIARQAGIALETSPNSPHDRDALAREILLNVDGEVLNDHLRYAASHRSEFMWPWEQEPRSVATGILDDETYDWLALVGAMLHTGGYPLVVDERTLRRAHAIAHRHTSIPVDPTGTAGLAGCLQLTDAELVGYKEDVAVLFTGVERD